MLTGRMKTKKITVLILPIEYKGQFYSISIYPAAAINHRVAPYRQRALHFCVSRRRTLSCDLGAEMLLIMRPDKPALCRVFYNKKNIP
ncbi:unnamed protein product [Danaus chrysippus]|uniref:(African queen) hypothetical protein n=1 Tax=Danaus chrysippus TaxID=151541 RepID=A0A8J2QSW9_9NEOP|nr:unnamed protein product [Danaus chrysippus]